MLFEKKILNTRDLIKAAHGVQTHVQIGDNEPITIALNELFVFCNKHLCGMKLHLKTAHTEKHVVVTGCKPNTIVSHVPDQVMPVDIASALSYKAPIPEFVTDAYNWNEEDLNMFPPECYCPITTEVFEDAVVLEDGFTYENEAIMEWLRVHDTSPMTGETLFTKTIFPNKVIMQLIRRLT
tara:strand:- start:237 stop:779 length:543 start_codon:yes stop_codon:yes gene_type:complete